MTLPLVLLDRTLTTIMRRKGGVEELRGVLALAKAELMRVQRERDKDHSGRNAGAQGATTTTRERDEVKAERDAVHAQAREARDTTRKGCNDLVTLVEEECAAILEERGGHGV
jgi:hypothetical protein